MSTETNAEAEAEEVVTIWKEDDVWVARDEASGVASQGDTKTEALAMLSDALSLHRSERGEPVTDEDLEEWGIDPDDVPDEPQVPDAPWFDSE